MNPWFQAHLVSYWLSKLHFLPINWRLRTKTDYLSVCLSVICISPLVCYRGLFFIEWILTTHQYFLKEECSNIQVKRDVRTMGRCAYKGSLLYWHQSEIGFAAYCIMILSIWVCRSSWCKPAAQTLLFSPRLLLLSYPPPIHDPSSLPGRTRSYTIGMKFWVEWLISFV